ncbi:MAG: enoyl-CoA hydratase/isomerase family protein [Chloroflexi bacterium]|nr:enoyl-CoA hydratase/isomerase family protein [Chloroflexota bacterium]
MKEVTEGSLLIRREGATAVLTLNRPQALNALNEEVLNLLREALGAAAQDSMLRCLVITGAGERAFCAGADIRQMRTMSVDDGRRWAQLGHDVFQQVEGVRLPAIAAINGLALGGGCELALACDFRVIADEAQIGQPEIRLGLIPGWGGTQRLPRLIGVTRAAEMVLTGRSIGAADAVRFGLANGAVPRELLLGHALEFAAQFATLPPLAVSYAKRAMHLGRDLPLREANGVEIDLFSQCFGTADKDEGIAAFLEKRAPRFRGE